MIKLFLTLIIIVAAFISLGNDVFAQDRPPFVVTVKGDGCIGLISGAEVYIYEAGTNNLLASAETNNGVYDFGSILPGNCPYTVDIRVTYGELNGNKLNVTRSCSGNWETVCLIPDR